MKKLNQNKLMAFVTLLLLSLFILFNCSNPALYENGENGITGNSAGVNETIPAPAASVTREARAVALLVGLKSVDPNAYNGWDGKNGCYGCENDVDSLYGILSPLGYSITTLKTAQATRWAIKNQISSIADSLYEGDIFVFQYSGHGGQRDDYNGDESDGKDETLVAYDGEIIDDELDELWVKFRAGVRIVTISDSCHSGTVYRNMDQGLLSPGTRANGNMEAGLIHMSGCRDDQLSAGPADGGAMTKALVRAWDNGNFDGNYQQFVNAIRANINSPSQTPEYHEYGNVSDGFRNQKPFTVGQAPSNTISLQARNNYHYVVAGNWGWDSMASNSPSVGTWEKFTLVYNNDGSVSLLSQANWRFVMASEGGWGQMGAWSEGIGTWEKFTLNYNDDGTVSLLSQANWRWVMASDWGWGGLGAWSEEIGDWEKFYIQYH